MSWYCVMTLPKKEYVALESIRRNLKQNDDWVYLPQKPVDWRYHKSLKGKMEPLFSRYLFCYLRENQDDFRKITKAPGVACMVHFGIGSPATLTEAVIVAVRSLEQAHRQPKDYHKGEIVRIKSLDNEMAEFKKRVGGWAIVLLGGNKIKTKVNLRDLEPAV